MQHRQTNYPLKLTRHQRCRERSDEMSTDPPIPKLRPGLALPFAEGGCVVLRVRWQKPPEPGIDVWYATWIGHGKTVAVFVEDDRAMRYVEGKK
jgi:hypothetical protein